MDRREKESTKSKIYIRYDEGAERYSMCRHTFMKLAAEAGAVYKINRLSLVNTKIFKEYLETFRVSVRRSDGIIKNYSDTGGKNENLKSG